MKKPIKEILHKINSAGFESYIVGGYVRDTILGIESFDIDICTSALYYIISCVFCEWKIHEIFCQENNNSVNFFILFFHIL